MEVFKSPVPVEWQNKLVLTTTQLAEYYGCAVENIRDNFRKNKIHFVESKHYFKLEGELLKQFKAGYFDNKAHSLDEIELIDIRTPHLYLWTVAGIFLHGKLLNTISAWELFSKIGDKLSRENHPVLDEIIFGKINLPKPKPDLACVYAFEFDNSLVKIGMSKNVKSRQGDIYRKLQFKVIRTYHTPFMSREMAHQIEKNCHKIFHSQLAYRQEYFNITFEAACEVIDSLLKSNSNAMIIS